MSYEQKSKSLLVFFVILVIGSCTLLFFSIRDKTINEMFYSIFSPVHTAGFDSLNYLVAFTEFPTLVANSKETERNFEKRIAELSLEITQLERFREDKKTLQQLLGYTQDTSYTTRVAKVLTFNPAAPYAQFTIDIGKNKGITRNNTVVAYVDEQLVLLGRTLQVAETSTQVLPVINQASNITARTLDGNYIGLTSGTGKTLVMRYVDSEARNTISVGTIVVSANESATVVAGIPIGQVTRIRENRQSFSLELSVQPFARYSSIEYVLVIQE